MDVTVGVDVGGTNTDAVVLSAKGEVKGKAKVLTSTTDLTGSVCLAVTRALNSLPEQARVHRVHIGTTHFVNAVVQRRGLARVAVVRLCGRATTSLPPFSDFPPDLKKVIHSESFLVRGGFEFDGSKIDDVDEKEIREVVQTIKNNKVSNIVVSGVFSPVNSSQETEVADLIHKLYPEASVTQTHHVGQVGLLERENAAILNESIKPLAKVTVEAFRQALDQLGLTCPFFLTQNDGTLISAEKTMTLPVHTFASGPTNSMRGAAFLSGVRDAIVVDIGGTTSDLGTLVKGFPREASFKVKVGEVQTNFRMPDVFSLGLGGGSLVKRDSSGRVVIGPQSVGYRLTQDALVFGGHTLTTSDVAVAKGLAIMGQPKSIVDNQQIQDVADDALKTIREMLEEAIDRVKVTKDDVPVILVGGGSVLIDDKTNLRGASIVFKPANYDVANAVGAALSKVSGTEDVVRSLESASREDVLEQVKQSARQRAINAGAQPDTTEVTDISDVPLAYLPGNVTRVKVTVVGDLQPPQQGDESAVVWNKDTEERNVRQEEGEADIEQESSTSDSIQYTDPTINENGEWELNEYDIEAIAIGAGILGTGGGGSPHIGKLRCKRALDEGRVIRVVTPEKYARMMKGGDLVLSVGEMGAPTICIERPSSLEEMDFCVDAYDKLLGSHEYDMKTGELDTKDFEKKQEYGATYVDQYDPPARERSSSATYRISAVTCGEIGGANSMEPLIYGAHKNKLVVDCDGMGRAFPELQMVTPTIYGLSPYPAAIADYKGNTSVITHAENAKSVENIFRLKCMQMGCAAPIAMDALSADDLLTKMVPHSVSRAWRLGSAVLSARKRKTDTLAAIVEHENARVLFTGKIADVARKTTGGFARGTLTIEGFDTFSGQTFLIDFQNEFLVATLTKGGAEQVLACTPDLISMVDTDTGEPIPTEEVRYGLRVSILGIPAPPLLKTPTALKVVGPAAFGYENVEFVPIGDYVQHKPVPPV